MDVLAVKALVFMTLLCGSPNGKTCTIDMYNNPYSGFIAVHATTKDLQNRTDYNFDYTQFDVEDGFTAVETEVLQYKLEVGTNVYLADYGQALTHLRKSGALYPLQRVTIGNKSYAFQETRGNYYLFDPNGDFILVMNSTQSSGTPGT